jgi:hypothetical protein
LNHYAVTVGDGVIPPLALQCHSSYSGRAETVAAIAVDDIKPLVKTTVRLVIATEAVSGAVNGNGE